MCSVPSCPAEQRLRPGLQRWPKQQHRNRPQPTTDCIHVHSRVSRSSSHLREGDQKGHPALETQKDPKRSESGLDSVSAKMFSQSIVAGVQVLVPRVHNRPPSAGDRRGGEREEELRKGRFQKLARRDGRILSAGTTAISSAGFSAGATAVSSPPKTS